MWLTPSLLFLLTTSTTAQPNLVTEKFIDCAVRRAAWTFALSLQPSRNNSDIFDALQLGVISRGVAACRAASTGACTVLLRDSAPFYLPSPLLLNGSDSGLTLAAYPGESPLLSGGVPLTSASWTRVPSALPDANIWRAHTPLPTPPAALLLTTRRLPRARWPNGNADLDTLPTGWANASAWHARPPSAPATPLPGAWSRPEDHFFPDFVWGVNGSGLGSFDPPEGYWLAPSPAGGPTYAVPGAFSYNPADFSPRVGSWTRQQAAVVHAFHGGYWGSWQFAVASVNGSVVQLGEGGWQEARGWPTGGALYMDNLLEELDAPGEWYYDADSGLLTLWNPTPGPPQSSGGPLTPVAAQLEVLINATASAGCPLLNLTLQGLTLTASQPTYLSRRFRAPSGGDWSFSESAALVLSHTQGAVVRGCTFTGLGGNGVLVSGANAGARVEGCQFSRLGESGVVACGERGILQDLRGKGVPVGTAVVGNVFEKMGVFVKQSGAFYAALAANSTVSGNIAFNMPRACINVNDGAHGGHAIEGNLFFLSVTESADHGAINSWDRQPYLRGLDASGQPLLYGETSRCARNFLLCDGYGIHALDTDDGSNHWLHQGNLLAFCGIKNYLGFAKAAVGNLIVRPDYSPGRAPGEHTGATPAGVPLPPAFYFPACVRSLGQYAWGALGDAFSNNTCVLGTAASPYILGQCNASAPQASGAVPVAAGNAYLTPSSQVGLLCGGRNLSLAEAQAVGWERGSTAGSSAEYSNSAAGGAALQALIEGFMGV